MASGLGTGTRCYGRVPACKIGPVVTDLDANHPGKIYSYHGGDIRHGIFITCQKFPIGQHVVQPGKALGQLGLIAFSPGGNLVF